MPANGPAATVLPVACETSRASLSSPSWRAWVSIIRRDLIEKRCRENAGNALSATAFIFFLIEKPANAAHILLRETVLALRVPSFFSHRGGQVVSLQASAGSRIVFPLCLDMDRNFPIRCL